MGRAVIMLVSVYYKPSLFNAHTMILIVHVFMTVNKLCFKPHTQKSTTTKKKNVKNRQSQLKKEEKGNKQTNENGISVS